MLGQRVSRRPGGLGVRASPEVLLGGEVHRHDGISIVLTQQPEQPRVRPDALHFPRHCMLPLAAWRLDTHGYQCGGPTCSALLPAVRRVRLTECFLAQGAPQLLFPMMLLSLPSRALGELLRRCECSAPASTSLLSYCAPQRD